MRANGTAIRAFRQANGVALRTLEKRTGKSRGYLSRLENGQRDATASTLTVIADVLGVPVGAITNEVLVVAR